MYFYAPPIYDLSNLLCLRSIGTTKKMSFGDLDLSLMALLSVTHVKVVLPNKQCNLYIKCNVMYTSFVMKIQISLHVKE